MKKRHLKVAAYLLSLIILMSLTSGCKNVLKSTLSKIETNKTKVVKSTDKATEVTVPESWQDLGNINEAAKTAYGNKAQEKYLLVISESKEDFTSEITVDMVCDAIIENMKTTIQNAKATEPKNIKVNNMNAKQFEISGEVKGIKLSYVVTLVDGKKGYHQILTWTLQSKFEEYKSQFIDVTNTFKEL